MSLVNIAVIDVTYTYSAFGAELQKPKIERLNILIPKEITAEQEENAVKSMIQNIKIAYSAPFPLQPSEVKLVELVGRPQDPKDIIFPHDHKFWQYNFELEEFNKSLEEFKKTLPEIEARYISDEVMYKFWKHLKKAE